PFKTSPNQEGFFKRILIYCVSNNPSWFLKSMLLCCAIEQDEFGMHPPEGRAFVFHFPLPDLSCKPIRKKSKKCLNLPLKFL
ncbi:MAG: hypothetical protein ABI419_05715, partial [Ginsengibacter sp.]